MNKLSSFKGLILILIGLIWIVSCSQNEKEIKVITFETTLGPIVIELFEEEAPITSKNFLEYAESGFFNGTLFHRVIPGFVIQGGDPNSKNDDRSKHGVGGHAAKFYGVGNEKDSSSWMLPSEFNSIDHTLGVLSMARAQDPNSANSQFFICFQPAPFLDRQYTVFGKVVEGMEFVDKIKRGDQNNNGAVTDPDKIISFKSL